MEGRVLVRAFYPAFSYQRDLQTADKNYMLFAI